MKRRLGGSAPTAPIAILLGLLDEGYDRSAWHGPNLRGSLRGVSARNAAWRPAPGRHNVWELALHAAYWKHAARRRLTGGKRGAFPAKGSNWFRRPAEASSEKAWRADLALLEREHRALREVVARFPPKDLARRKGRRSATQVIAGVAAHDVYHAGQIQLVKALRRARHGR